ncbi:protein SERAC1 [Marchantia polymorpha subsp. ruderalis]
MNWLERLVELAARKVADKLMTSKEGLAYMKDFEDDDPRLVRRIFVDRSKEKDVKKNDPDLAHVDNAEGAMEVKKRVILGRLVYGMYDWSRGAEEYEEWWTKSHYDLWKLDKILTEDELNLYATEVQDQHKNKYFGVFRQKEGSPFVKDGDYPDWVVAIGGTQPESIEDLIHDFRIFVKKNNFSKLITILEVVVRRLVVQHGNCNVNVTGHSIGAAVGLVVCRGLALEGCLVEGHFFNPPLITRESPHHRRGKAELEILAEFGWYPNLYVNKYDHVSSSFLSYFASPHLANLSAMIQSISNDFRHRLRWYDARFPDEHIVKIKKDQYHVDRAHGLLVWLNPEYSEKTHVALFPFARIVKIQKYPKNVDRAHDLLIWLDPDVPHSKMEEVASYNAFYSDRSTTDSDEDDSDDSNSDHPDERLNTNASNEVPEEGGSANEIASMVENRINDELYVLYEPSDGLPYDTEIIFVHDLYTEGCRDAWRTTWTNEDGVCWPKQFLAEKFPRARMLSVSYDACVTTNSTQGRMDSLYVIAENLMHNLFLQSSNVGQTPNCPVFFVGHGLGCFVIKKLMITVDSYRGYHQERRNRLMNNVGGFVFYSPFNFGVKWNLYEFESGQKNPLANNLIVHHPELSRLNGEFSKLRRDMQNRRESKLLWSVLTICESHPTASKAPGHQTSEPFVSEGTARFDCELFLFGDGDHFSLCKPLSMGQVGYQSVEDFIANILEESYRGSPPKFIPKFIPTSDENKSRSIQGGVG